MTAYRTFTFDNCACVSVCFLLENPIYKYISQRNIFQRKLKSLYHFKHSFISFTDNVIQYDKVKTYTRGYVVNPSNNDVVKNGGTVAYPITSLFSLSSIYLLSVIERSIEINENVIRSAKLRLFAFIRAFCHLCKQQYCWLLQYKSNRKSIRSEKNWITFLIGFMKINILYETCIR